MYVHLLSEFLVLDNVNDNNITESNFTDNHNYVLNNEIDVHMTESLENVSDNNSETILDNDSDNDSYNDINNYENLQQKCNLFYNEQLEIQNEIAAYNYHLHKNSYNWLLAKKIVSLTVENKANTEFFWDYLDILFNSNTNTNTNTNTNNNNNDEDNNKDSNSNHNHDNFDDIQKVIFSFDNNVFEFNNIIAKYLVDNLKIFKYKPSGYLFNKNNNEQNKFNFKIVVITHKNVYSVNRYIDENKLGFY
jgi:hypothetical protein